MEKINRITRALSKPIGSKPYLQCLRGKKDLLIVCDDFTRQTPLKEILPCLIRGALAAGISEKRVRILIAAGTHRGMTRQELKNKLGKNIADNFKICQHDWLDSRALIKIDAKDRAGKFYVNRMVLEADFVVGVGSILPHATCGFSGGGKIILPGICGRKTLEDMHWKALDFKIGQILGVYANPMRSMIDKAAKTAGLKFIVNTVLDCSGKIKGVFAGDPVLAHRQGVRLAKSAYGVYFKGRAGIVIADARPMDIDLRQAIKAVAASELLVKKGGVIILIARCPEGVAPQFPEFEKYGFSQPERLKAMVEKRMPRLKLMAYTLIAIGRIMKESRVILVSAGIGHDLAGRLGFIPADSLNDALALAKEIVGKSARVARLERACEALPLLN